MTNEEAKTETMNRETSDLEDIFRDFFTFADFDPDADDGYYEGNLLGHRYDLWELCRTITKIVRDYNSEALAFVMLRAGAEDYFASEQWSIRDFAENKCSQEIQIYKEIYGRTGDEIEEEFLGMMTRLTAKPNLIGKSDRKDILSRVPAVIEKSDRLNFHPLLSSGLPLGEVEIRNKIRVFSDMGQCLIDIEQRADGLYMCCINPKDSVDGYFSFVYKSNGNIVSVDDCIKEEYIGQHRRLRVRNARYTEEKSFAVFPYDFMLVMGKPDAKGCFTEYRLRGDFTLDELPAESLFSVCLSMLLILRKYMGKTVDGKKICYSTYLAGSGGRKLPDGKALTVRPDGAVAAHSKIAIELTEDEIFGFTKEHKQDGGRITYNCQPMAVNRLISLYYDDKVKQNLPMQKDYSCLLNDTSFIEGLCTLEEMTENARYIMRSKAADEIQKNIDDYFASHDFGNEAVHKWREIVIQKKAVIYSKLKKEDFREEKSGKGIIVGYGYISRPEYFRGIFYPFNDLSNIRFDGRRWAKTEMLWDNRGQCRYSWTFEPRNWIEACLFVGIDESELPKEMIGWTRSQNQEYGNSLLDRTDKMERLQSGFMSFYDYYHSMCVSESEYMGELFRKKYGEAARIDDKVIYDRKNPFGFSIAMSRRTFKKLFPENIKIQQDYEHTYRI